MEQIPSEVRLLRFGVYELDLQAGELRKSGRKVGLQEQPFQVLAVLLAHAGELVPREELQKRLWPADTFVDFDLGLNTAIKKIRIALGDSADNPKFVETLPRKGYRFICPVEKIIPAAPLPVTVGTTPSQNSPQAKASTAVELSRSAGSRRWLAAGAIALLLIAGVGWYRLSGKKASLQAVPSLESLKLQEQGTLNSAAHQAYLKGEDSLHAYDVPEKSENAIQSFQQAIKEDPNFALAYAGLGQAYWNQYEATHSDQWSEQAQGACNRSLELDHQRVEAWVCEGRIHNGIGQHEQAISDLSKALEINSRSTAAYRGRAWAFQGLNNYVQAEKDYLQAINIDPHDWNNHNALGQLYLVQGRYNDAIRQYREVIRTRPDNAEVLSNLGVAYINTGQYDQAVPVLSESVRFNPSSKAYENLGTALLDLRRLPEAVPNFEKAAAMSPASYQVIGNLARAYFWSDHPALATQKYEQAIAMAKQRLTENAKDPDAYLSLAIFYAMLKQDDPRYYLDQAYLFQPDDPETSFWAAVVRLRSGNKEEALAWVRRAHALGYTAEINAAPELDSLRNDPEFHHIMSSSVTPVTLSTDSGPNRRNQ